VRRRLAALSLVLLAGGCATLPAPAPGDDWPARRAALQALEAWTLDGRIAVAAGDDGFSGGFDWRQQGSRADIALTGPMGAAAMDIRAEGERAVVSVAGESYEGEDAAALFARYFGPDRKLPIVQMRYWLVGAPAPELPHEETLGADRRLAALSQSGWQVRYDRYEPVGDLALPARMEMTTPGLRLRVVVSDWRLVP
jgi:outer membrane lipoprotein LolB